VLYTRYFNNVDFMWYPPVFYYNSEGKIHFPKSKEKLGRFVGIIKEKGDSFIFNILTAMLCK